MASKFQLFCLFAIVKTLNSQTTTVSTTQATLSTTLSTPKLTTTTATTTTSPPDTSLSENTDLGPCTCDMTANGCDVECCCDSDCSDDDIKVFSQCRDQYNPADSQMCVQSNIVFLNNIPTTVNDTVPGLFCVERDNYEERNYYKIPELVTTETDFEEYAVKYGGYSYGYKPTSSINDQQYYKVGDAIITIYENDATGYLGLPQGLQTDVCVDTNPAAFLDNIYSECERTVKDLETECATNLLFSAPTYFRNFKILKSPGLLDSSIEVGDGNNTVASEGLYNSSIGVEISSNGPHVCMDIDGLNTTCNFVTVPSPTLVEIDGQLYCQHVPIKVEYKIICNGTEGIRSADVTFTLAPIQVASQQFTQGFGTTFIPFNSEAGFQRSGNPGYQIGQPLLAGRMVEHTDILLGTHQAISLDGDRYNRMTIVTSSPSGECMTEPNNRASMLFGENMRSGCNIRVTYSNMTESCALIQDAATNAMRGSYPPEYVATFGNTPVESTGDWVAIQVQGEPTSPSQSQIPGTCTDMVMGLQIEIVYVNVGALGNPQAKIIGVLYRYSEPENIHFQCVGRYCRPDTKTSLSQTFEIISSVSFIDASESAIAVDRAKPKFSARLPEDFFYPFK